LKIVLAEIHKSNYDLNLPDLGDSVLYAAKMAIYDTGQGIKTPNASKFPKIRMVHELF
jgi:hypothetical protein